jgi:hypothetical protein
MSVGKKYLTFKNASGILSIPDLILSRCYTKLVGVKRKYYKNGNSPNYQEK